MHLQQLKGMQSFCLSIEGIRKDYLFREKWYVKQGKGLDLGAGPPIQKFVEYPPPPPGCDYEKM